MNITITNAQVSAFVNDTDVSYSIGIKGKDKDGNTIYTNLKIITTKNCNFEGKDFKQGSAKGSYYGYFDLTGFLVPMSTKTGLKPALMLMSKAVAEKPDNLAGEIREKTALPEAQKFINAMPKTRVASRRSGGIPKWDLEEKPLTKEGA